jgi:NAD(P)-dependent dehydrogenase (short-subunit alcohol dehydrogenase family)
MADVSMTAPAIPNFRLDGKMALVTGASRGIGSAMAPPLAQAGEKVARTPVDRASPFRLLLLTAAVALFAATPAFAETPPRVRGVVIGANGNSITVRERDGSIVTLKTGADTAYAYVVPSNLDAIKVNDFVGTAVKGPMKSMVAVELVIIPESMRAGRISYYGWDPLPDLTVGQTSDTAATSMTNGLVSNVSPASRRLTNTNMTNGVVSAENGGAAGLTLTVSYDGGSKSFRITVPPIAPITRFEVADRSAVAIGSSVFIKTIPGNQADLITVGKGVTPPM